MNNIYLGTIDGSGDGKELLIAAINRITGKNYVLEDFDFGNPEPVDVPTPTHNTVVRFGAKAISKHYGVSRVYYNRIHASELGVVVVPFTGQARISDLLPAINEKYGVLIHPSDIVDGPTPALQQGSNNVRLTLEFSASSLIFYSSAQVQLGLNDPTGDTVVQEPYKTALMIAMNQTQDYKLDGVDRKLIDFYTLGMDRDNIRKSYKSTRGAFIRNAVSDFTRFGLPAAAYNKLAHMLPFAGMWFNQTTNKYHAITIHGDVFAISAQDGEWSYQNNLMGYDTSNNNVVVAGQANPFVKAVAQGSDGAVYVLGKPAVGAPRVYKGTVAGTDWTAQSVATTRIKSLTESEWNNLTVHDSLFSAGRMYVLISTPTQYDLHQTKSRDTPSIEVLNVTQGTSNYYPLANTVSNYSGIGYNETNPNNRWRLITPLADAVEVDAVALLATKKNGNVSVVHFKYNPAGEYTADIVPHAPFATSESAFAEMDIQGYKLPAGNLAAATAQGSVTGHYLEVIEVLTAVEVDEFSRYFVRTATRTQQKYLAYGVCALVSVATRNLRSVWSENSIPMLSSQRPATLLINAQGRRQHYIAQNADAIHSLRFRQVLQTQNIEPILDSTRSLTGTNSAEGIGRQGAGVYVEKTVIADVDTPLMLTPQSDPEATMAPIVYSFIGKKPDGKREWLTAQQPNTLLVKRVPSVNYKFMGEVPAAVFAEGNNLLVWSKENGIYKTTNSGASFSEFSSAPVFYRQERPATLQQNIIGQSKIAVSDLNFGEAVLVNGVLTLEMKLSESARVLDMNASAPNTLTTLNDEMLFVVSEAQGGVPNYTQSNPQEGFGLNALSNVSPRSVFAWDTDADNNRETIGTFTTNLAAIGGEKHNQMNYIYGIPGQLIDFSRDVKYLGVRHWVLMNNGGVYHLHFTDAVVPTKTIGLFGDTGSAFETFLPEVNFHLWDYINDQTMYAPYVFYGAGKILLLEPIDENDDFNVSQHILNIPADNGNPLVPLKMFTANRRDYLFYQKGNGIFKLTYNHNVQENIHLIGMERLFSTSGNFADMDFESGCIAGIAARNAPMESTLPEVLPEGVYMGEHCEGFTLVETYADGQGGYTTVRTELSLDCDYVPPAQGTPEQDIGG